MSDTGASEKQQVTPESSLAERVAAVSDHFHSPMDFGDGIITKPKHVQRRFARRMRLLDLPADMTGMTVLDIGAWDGYFSFEFERRGAARVLAVDTFAWRDGGIANFLLAHEHFKSKVEYRELDAHDLSPDLIGTFDLVFCCGVLYHLRHPLMALERIRSVTAGHLVMETHSLIPATHERFPIMTFFPGDTEANVENRPRHNWRRGGFPTQAWVSDALTSAGFARHEFVYTPSMKWAKKMVALATGVPQSGRLIVKAYV